jgi:hypothetical protein
MFVAGLVIAIVQFVPRGVFAEELKADSPTASESRADEAASPASNSQASASVPEIRVDPAKLEPWLYSAARPNVAELRDSISKGQEALLKSQSPDGPWQDASPHAVGKTSLALLALHRTGFSKTEPEFARGLNWLRGQNPTLTYEISLLIQILAEAGDFEKDAAQISKLAKMLQDSQIPVGADVGSWSYTGSEPSRGDHSNSQFAILGLHAAEQAGEVIPSHVWVMARQHWTGSQYDNGSWSYTGPRNTIPGTGSMTAAGIASLEIIQGALHRVPATGNNGSSICPIGDPALTEAVQKGRLWLGQHYSSRKNPDMNPWFVYYLAGVLRAGQFGGQRYLPDGTGGQRDWHRDAAEYLLSVQNKSTGAWLEAGDTIATTGFALLILSRGLEPVLVSKLEFPTRPAADGARLSADKSWNRHPQDIANLLNFAGRQTGFPRHATWQTVDISQLQIAELKRAPIVYLSGEERPDFTPEQKTLIQSYLANGGALLADASCQSQQFDKWFREVAVELAPAGSAGLRPLAPNHPIYRGRFDLVDGTSGVPAFPLWGVEIDGRTAIVYSPHGLSCLWERWTPRSNPALPANVAGNVTAAIRTGTNIAAYLTERAIQRQK